MKEKYTEGWPNIWLESNTDSGGYTQMVQLLSNGQKGSDAGWSVYSKRQREGKTLCMQINNYNN